MHQLFLTKHWRRVRSSHCPTVTIKLKLEWSVLPQFSREAVRSLELTQGVRAVQRDEILGTVSPEKAMVAVHL